MSIQLSDLTVTDPLAEQEVAVVIRVLPDSAQRPARTALVSVGTPRQPPVFVSGVLENIGDLIRQAWLTYGAQAEMRQTAVEDADEDGEDETPPAAPVQPQPQAQPARPQPQNLTLF